MTKIMLSYIPLSIAQLVDTMVEYKQSKGLIDLKAKYSKYLMGGYDVRNKATLEYINKAIAVLGLDQVEVEKIVKEQMNAIVI